MAGRTIGVWGDPDGSNGSYYNYTAPIGQRGATSTRLSTGGLRVFHYDGNGADIWFDFSYTYDKVGNVSSLYTYASGSGPDTQTFSYDHLDRLVTADGTGNSGQLPGYSHVYQYSKIGNITSAAGVSYTYGDAALKQAVTATSDGGSYFYDANGNMILRLRPGATYNQTFDAENRLVEVEDGSSMGGGRGATPGDITTFVYDAGGQRVKTVEPNGDIIYYPFPTYEEEVRGATTVKRRTYTLAGQVIANWVYGDNVPANNGLHYFYTDHLGSAAVLGNASGGKIAGSEGRYYPFGGWREQPTTNPSLTDRGFTGQKHQDSVGLIYYNARYYIPGLHRFASADTIVPDPTAPQSYNRYSYVRNRPLNATDPSGHSECEDIGVGCEPLPPPPPLPSSYVRISLTIRIEGGRLIHRDMGAGVAIDSNAILTHSHLPPYGFDQSQIESVAVSTASGELLSLSSEFVIADSDELGEGLRLIVFKEDFTTDSNTASLGTVTDSIVGQPAEQAVRRGAEERGLPPGLYPTTVQSLDIVVRKRGGEEYNALQVSPDLTIKGDSGSPLLINDRVYGVNNAGSGLYGQVTDIALIRSLVTVMTDQLR